MRAKALILINRTAGIGKAGNSLMKVVEKYAMNGLEPIVYPIIPGSDLTSELIIAAHKADFADYDEYISRKNTSEKDAKKFSGIVEFFR